jgi:hypothetical protein
MKRTLIALAALLVTGSLANADPPKPQNSCFFVTQFRGWKAADPQTMYIKADPNLYYRLDLVGQCPDLLRPDAHLVTVHRSSTVCSALDWDLKVGTTTGPAVPCIVKKMTQLTPAEVAQLPPKIKPQ